MKSTLEKIIQYVRFQDKIKRKIAAEIRGDSMHLVPDVQWMFKGRGVKTLSHWARSLAYFRFTRCDNNPRNSSSDQFCCEIHYKNEEAMLVFLRAFGIHFERQPDPSSIHHLERHPDFPGYSVIRPARYPEFDAWCSFCFLRGHRLVLSVYDSEKPYTVTAKDFEGAKRIEAVLHPFASWVIDPPQDNWLCLCPKYWPEVFAR